MSSIANMSNKQAVLFIISMTSSFAIFLSMLIAGLILVIPGKEVELLPIILISVGGGLLFVTIFFLALASLSSNYMKRKEQKNN